MPRAGLPEQAEASVVAAGSSTTALRFAVLGNCQMEMVGRCIQALTGGPIPARIRMDNPGYARLASGETELAPLFAEHDKVFVQPWLWAELQERYGHFHDKVVLCPSIIFLGFHPDLIPIVSPGGDLFPAGPTGHCHSSLAFLGWKAGLSPVRTAQLFNADIYQRLGFYDHWSAAEQSLLEEGRAAGMPLDGLLKEWMARGCFMHCHVHPKLFALGDITRRLLQRLGVELLPGNPLEYVHDVLSLGVVWPVYPEIGAALGIPGSYAFKPDTRHLGSDGPLRIFSLEDFIEQSFEAYSRHAAEHGPDSLRCVRLEEWEIYRGLFEELQRQARPPAAAAALEESSVRSGHPYQGLPPHHYWRQSIGEVAGDQVDPVVAVRFRVDRQTRIATAGSCFAQHINNRLRERGFRVLQTEQPPEQLSPAQALQRNYGMFCARYGNIYTARHLLQLIERAYGGFVPAEPAWPTARDRWIDPFRPQIEPDGFASIEALEQSRIEHLAAVRRMFETLDLFVFTLGLTEAWRAKPDGAVFPLAPGVAGGTMDFARYEFVNFGAAEVEADLDAFLGRLRQVNPAARVIFTVSPVPLAATYTERGVLAATTYSKSVLRVAAEQIVQRHGHCDYFPSYEVISGNFNRGRYYEADLRSVTGAGVDHVMRLFFRHFTPSADIPLNQPVNQQVLEEARRAFRVLCDEDLLAPDPG